MIRDFSPPFSNEFSNGRDEKNIGGGKISKMRFVLFSFLEELI